MGERTEKRWESFRRCLVLSLSLAYTLSLSLSHLHNVSLSLTQTLTLFLSFFLSFFISHSISISLHLTCTHTHPLMSVSSLYVDLRVICLYLCPTVVYLSLSMCNFLFESQSLFHSLYISLSFCCSLNSVSILCVSLSTGVHSLPLTLYW